jgi:hypothetical protein
MWKVLIFLAVLVALAPFALRYLRKNPLDPVIEGNQVVVETQDYKVRLARNGRVSGKYFLSDVRSDDWTALPANVELSVVDYEVAESYLRTYSDLHRYGSETGKHVAQMAQSLDVIGANRAAYSDLRSLLDRHEDREQRQGERLCVTLSGESLSLDSAESLEDGGDASGVVEREGKGAPIVFVDQVSVEDCARMIAAPAH